MSAMGEAAIEPFRIEVPDEALEGLRRRLAATRWPPPEPVADWSQGVPLAYLRDLCEYWESGYDWRRAEARLNALPQFRTQIDGATIHFIHLRSPHAEALPLVMTHGWPGSVLEFLDAAGPLVDPTAHGGEVGDAFHLVIPALPGFGWSEAPAETGWGPSRIGRAWAELMARLGYERFGAQGGDWGSAVSRAVGRSAPDRVLGIHLNSDHVERAVIARLGAEEEFERYALARREAFNRDGRGYSRLQATRPQTLGAALADSPAGQCAWIVEKFAAWSDGDGDPERVFTRDALLDNVSLYWLTNSAASSARLYWEAAQAPAPFDAGGVPIALSTFPRDIHPIPERWARAQEPNLVYFNRLARGGHFAAMEVPDLFVAEVRAAFRAMRVSRRR
jgi:pimeloyl-ACP methyl ester carboxylesterase